MILSLSTIILKIKNKVPSTRHRSFALTRDINSIDGGLITIMTTYKSILLAGLLFVPYLTTNAEARVNIATTGLTLAYDYDDRKYETGSTNDDDDYQSIDVTPFIQLISTGIKDRIEIRASPTIRYDLIDSETDWDNDFFLSAERSITKNWRIIGSNSLLRTDYYESSTSTDTETTQDTSPELSADLGRNRYWQNTFDLASEHLYGQQSSLSFGFNYIILRNDESDDITYDDYDRYEGRITNEHRFSQDWRTITNLSAVKGDIETVDPTSLIVEDKSLSDDLMEYRFRITGENDYSRQTIVSLTYDYIGTRYDEDLQVDGDIYQAQLRWIHNYARQTTITLGAGPSYEKSEGQDSNTGYNGIAEINYQGQHGSLTLGAEKRYDVDNFSGTTERGFVDTWETRLLADYQILSNLIIDSRLSYAYEDRTDSSTDTNGYIILERYNNDIYVSGVALRYNFLRNYTASLEYTFTKQESDVVGDDYDDHRVLVSLSWTQDIIRW
jgi:hypothetical protein